MQTTAKPRFNFYDYHPDSRDFRGDVLRGLGSLPKAIPPKYFYDQEGSALFDRICQTPEYYVTRTELKILEHYRREIACFIDDQCMLIEPGSGESHKVRMLLETVKPAAYVPMDISRECLLDAANRLAGDFPWLDVHAVCVDYTRDIQLPRRCQGIRRLAFFPGSTIGNFEPIDAIRFLADLGELVGVNGGLLIGVDLKKDEGILNAAYNDGERLTARFNLNLLTRINNELDGNIDLTSFAHSAFYNRMKGRVEMHLISTRKQQVCVAGQYFAFEAGETIHTESSYKYTVEEFQRLAAHAGFESVQCWTDPSQLFSVHYLVYAGAAE
jgi:dimethylhistidine N-methyltransferase